MGSAFRFRTGRALPFQNPRPVEFDVRVVLLDQPDGIFIERGAPDPDARRRAEPVQDAGARPAPPSTGMDDKRVLVAALVATEPQKRQDYFLFCVRVSVLRTPPAATAFRADRAGGLGGAAFARLGAAFGLATTGARRGSATAERCTSVNRV